MDGGLIQVWADTPTLVQGLLGLIASLGLTGLGILIKWGYGLSRKAEHAFTNCIPTIQKNTGETRDAIIELSAIIKTKIELDGDL
jgi:hypothetical protein